MVDCADITDEDECKIHDVCTCEWYNGKCLFALSLPYNQTCNKLLIPKIYQLLDLIVKNTDKHSITYSKHNVSLNSYITSLNPKEKKDIFIKLRDDTRGY